MLNTSLLNSSPLNAWLATISLDASQFDMIGFETLNLQDSNIVATNIVDSSAPSRELTTFRIPRGNGEGILGDYFRQRKIVVTGFVKDVSEATLESRLNSMKRILCTREGYLYRKVGGNYKCIKATLTNSDAIFSERQGYHINFCPFTLEFTSYEPMWHDVNSTPTSLFGITNLAYSDQIENLGSYKAPANLIVIFDSVSSVTAFQFKNNTNGQSITITRTFNANDVLIIDGENKRVTVNDVEVDYSGTFPELEYSANSYTLTTTGSAVSISYTIQYKKSYL